jgi:hypothetical protein
MNDPQRNLSLNKDMAARSAALFWSQHSKNADADGLNEGNTTPPVVTVGSNGRAVYSGGNPYTDHITKGIASDAASYPKRFRWWRDNIALSHTGGNPYEDLSAALARVGIKATGTAGYKKQIGIALRVPHIPVDIEVGSHSLMVDAPEALDLSGAERNTGSRPAAGLTELIEQARTELTVNREEIQVFTADIPDLPNDTTGTIVLARSSERTGSIERPGVLGVCDIANNYVGGGTIGLSPLTLANAYFVIGTKGPGKEAINAENFTVTVIKQPMHGSVELHPTGIVGQYQPSVGYLGKDSLILEVRGNGHAVRIHYFLMLTDDAGQTFNNDKVCKGGGGGGSWRISGLPLQDAQPQDRPTASASSLSSWTASAQLSALLADASQAVAGFARLSGGKLGVIKDPFGKLGAPEFIAATLPLDGYGIVNLSLSADGKVLIGQLKGGYSANIFDMAQKENQNHAWNVRDLINAAVANQMQQHIRISTNAEQLIPVSAAGTYGASALKNAWRVGIWAWFPSLQRTSPQSAMSLSAIVRRTTLVTPT